MIELFQMRGRDRAGKRHVFPVDIVYRVEGGEREKLGFLNRKPGAFLSPIVPFAEDEIEPLTAEVNAAREEQGKFGPIAGIYSRSGAHTPRVQQEIARLQQEGSDDDE